jgi:hypothetical protein
MYKKTFASNGNEDITIGLIHDFFGLMPKKLIFKMPYSIDAYRELVEKKEISTLRQSIKDVSASMITADFIGELQMKKLRYFDERFFLYLCDDYRSNYNEAEKMAKIVAEAKAKGITPRVNRYSSLKPVYQLIILGENHYTDEHPLRIFEPYDPKRELRPDRKLFKQAYFELGKDKAKLETANQRYWHDYFVSGEVATSAPAYIQRAVELLAVSSLSKEEREVMSLVERAVADYEADMADAEYEAECRIARRLLNMGMSHDNIQKATGLELGEIENLAAQSV